MSTKFGSFSQKEEDNKVKQNVNLDAMKKKLSKNNYMRKQKLFVQLMNSGDKSKMAVMPNSMSPDQRATKMQILPKQFEKIKDSKELSKNELEIL